MFLLRFQRRGQKRKADSKSGEIDKLSTFLGQGSAIDDDEGNVTLHSTLYAVGFLEHACRSICC